MSKRHHSDYDELTTARCERALVTLLGGIGPWSQRVYLAGGLAPRSIVGSLPDGGDSGAWSGALGTVRLQFCYYPRHRHDPNIYTSEPTSMPLISGSW